MSRRLLAALLIAATAACGNAAVGTAKDHYARGLAALEAGQPRTARVELLNAIKAAPEDGRIRVAQARTYLELGDGVAAEAELERARASGVAAAELHHLRAHALLLRGEPEAAAEEAAEAPADHGAYAARMRGRALAALGQSDEAAAAFEAAAEAAPKDAELWTDIARFRRDAGDVAGALAAADRAVAADPERAEALTLRGELTRGQYGLEAALPWFDRALEVDPENVTALLERAATLADLGRMSAMLADTRLALELSPGHPTAYRLQAILAARARKFELARALWERTGGAFDHQPASMLLAGAIDLEMGSPVQAAQRLHRLVSLQPDNAKARRLLALALWRAGDAKATLAVLRPLAERPDADSYVLTLTGNAFAKLGDEKAANFFLARALSPAVGTAPLAPVSDGDLAALRRADPDDPGAQIQLVRALLGRGLGSEALQRARALRSAHPGAPDSHMLVGDAYGIVGNFAAAAGEYRKAANLAFTEPVALKLVEALRNAGDPNAAARVLELFLRQNPQNVPAQLLAANAYLQAGRHAEAIPLYERVRRRVGDRDSTLLNNLAWAYAQNEDYEAALPLARKALALAPDSAAAADTLGWILYRSGEDPARGLALLERARRG